MIVIHTFSTQGETLAIGNALDAAGIPYIITGDDAIPSTAFSEGGIHLQVDEADAERAKEVLQGAVPVGEIITDPEFLTLGEPGSPWECYPHFDLKMIACRDEDAVKIIQTGAKGVNWHAEFWFATFAVTKGETLRLNFEAKAEHPMKFSAWIGQRYEPWASLVSPEQHFGVEELSTEWQSFSLTAQMLADEPSARLDFPLGACDNTIWLRRISLARVS